jgi:NCS1 family nucleobase:cation symporter-1
MKGHSGRTATVELSPRLHNEDLAPAKERNWGTYSLFAMWMSDVHSIGGYTFAAGLFFLGLAAWQVGVALIAGIGIVYFLMLLSGRAGQQLGVPYPVLARVSFGVFGANLPALIRAVIAIAWYGIQTYLASVALQVLLLAIWPSLDSLTNSKFIGLSPFGWICFLTLSVVQALIIQRGMEMVRRYQDWAGPMVYVVMVALAIWILVKANFHISFNLSSQHLSTGKTWLELFSAAALVVAYFSTLLLNYCDFARFAPSQQTVKRGTFLGLPLNFAVFTVITVIVTAGSVTVFGEAIRDPVEIVARIGNTWVLILGAVMFTVATIGINIVANFVSPAYDLANVAPNHIDFRRGGMITSVLAVVVLPWYIFQSAWAVNYFLGGLGAVLGPLFGIIMADFYLLKKREIDVDELYRERGAYSYRRGWNPIALKAFLPAAAVSVILALVNAFHDVAPFSWFVGAGLGAGLYMFLNRAPRTAPAAMPAKVA